MRSLTVLILLLSLTAGAAERLFDVRQIPPTVWEQTDQTPTVMICPRTDKPPILDGKLNDPNWQSAGATGGFLKCDDNIAIDLPAQVPTEVRFCRDDDNLYFAWKLHGEPIKQAAEAIDPDKTYNFTGRGPIAVVILQPPGQQNWFRWTIQANGGAIGSFSQVEGKDYDAPVRHAIAPFADGAIVEMAIPFSSPQLHAPKQGEWWRMQFGRVDNHEWTAFPNSRGIFEQPVRYGYVLFDDLSKAESAEAPVPPAFELYGERLAYDAHHELTQFIAATTGVPLLDSRLRFTLRHGDEVIETLETELTEPKVAFTADLRGLTSGEYHLQGQVLREGEVVPDAPVGEWSFAITERTIERQPFPADGVPLQVHEQLDQPGVTWPVATAVPLPYGAVSDIGTLAVYEEGQRIPANLVVRSYWDAAVNRNPGLAGRFSGSVKWVGVAFNVRYDGKTPRSYVLRQESGDAPASPLVMTREGSRYTITTGPARFSFDGGQFAGIDAAWRDHNGDGQFGDNERRVIEGGGGYLIDHQGQRFEAARYPAEVTVEEEGPARIVIAVKGWYQAENGERLCLFHTRLTAYAGLPWVRFDQRTILTYDTRVTRLQDLGFHVALPKPRWSMIGIDGDNTASPKMNTPYWAARIHQDRHDHFRVLLENGESRDAATQTFASEGFRGAGLAAFRDVEANETQVILRDFWQKYPKELRIDTGGITLHFWPESGDDTYTIDEELRRMNFSKLLFAHEGETLEMQIPQAYADRFHEMATREYVNLGESINPGMGSNGQGVSISNSFLLYLGLKADGGTAPNPGIFQRDPQACAEPAYACATGALGPIHHQDRATYPHVERLLEEGYLFVKRYFEQTNAWGMFNTYDMFSQPLPVVRYPSTYRMWISSHHQQTETAWLMYFRSGSPEWLEWARGYSDHFMNIDTCNYDDPDNPMIGTTPDGKHLVGWMIHMAGAQYHCKAYVHWGSECNAATHWVSPHTYLLDYFLLGNYAARDNFDLWRSALNRMPLTTGASRDVNCTMAHLVPAYRQSGDPQLLLYIYRTGEALMNVAFKDHSSGHYHAYWPRRYYELTRDRRAVERAAEYADYYDGVYSDMLALAWRETGNRKYLDQAVNRTILSSRAMYLNPEDPMDGYSALRPLAGGSFELMSIPYYLAALQEAEIPLQWQPITEATEPKTVQAETEVAPGIWELAPAEAGPVILHFTGKTNRGYADYGGASLDATTIELTDANGEQVFWSSIAPGLQRPREAVMIDSAQHPAPWRLVIGSPVRLSATAPVKLVAK